MSTGKKLALVGIVAAGIYALNKRRKAGGSRAVTAVRAAVASLVEEPKARKPVRSKQGKRSRSTQAKRARSV